MSTVPKDIYFLVSAANFTAGFTQRDIDMICKTTESVPIVFGRNGPVIGETTCLFRMLNNGAAESLAIIAKVKGDTEGARLLRDRESRLVSVDPSITTTFKVVPNEFGMGNIESVEKKLTGLTLLNTPTNLYTGESSILRDGEDPYLFALLMCTLYYPQRVAYISEISYNWLVRQRAMAKTVDGFPK